MAVANQVDDKQLLHLEQVDDFARLNCMGPADMHDVEMPSKHSTACVRHVQPQGAELALNNTGMQLAFGRHKLHDCTDDLTEATDSRSQSMIAGGLLQAGGPFAQRCQQALTASIPSADVIWPKVKPHHAA